MMKSKLELIKENKKVTQTDDGVVEHFDYSKAMEEYAEQEKIAFAIEVLTDLTEKTFGYSFKDVANKLKELKSLQDEKTI